MRPPLRLLDDHGLEAELRTDLARSLGNASGYDAAAGAARLQATLTSQPISAGAEVRALGAPMSWSTHAWPWIAGALGAVGLGILALWLRSAQPTAPQRPNVCPCPMPTAASVVARCECRPAPSAPPQSLAAETPAPAPVTVVEGSARVLDDPSTHTRRELTQLARVHALLDSDPRAALRQLDASDRAFRSGTLQQERDALRVIAHSRLGERARAEALAHAFYARYPHSALRERVQHELGSPVRR